MPATGLRAHRTGSRRVQHKSVAPPTALSEPSDLPITAVLALCFLLSGLAALIYQTSWTRQFALVFGTSELAVATVLAAYMGGLALGAWLAERWLSSNPSAGARLCGRPGTSRSALPPTPSSSRVVLP